MRHYIDDHHWKTEQFHPQILRKISRTCVALFLLHSAFMRRLDDFGKNKKFEKQRETVSI